MADNDQIDHDALAAEWGVALEAERGPATVAEARAQAAAAATDSVESQWGAAMAADDATFMQASKGGAERVLTQE